MHSNGNGVHKEISSKWPTVPRNDKGEYDPDSVEAHLYFVKELMVSSHELNMDHWVYQEMYVIPRKKEEEERRRYLRKQYAQDKEYKASEGEVKIAKHTDWIEFQPYFQSKINSDMFRVWDYLDYMYCKGDMTKISQRDLAEKLNIHPKKLNRHIQTFLRYEEVCPICRKKGFKFLTISEKYNVQKKNGCDTYNIRPGIDFLSHLRLHVREFSTDGNTCDQQGWDTFKEKAERFKINFLEPEW